MVAAGSIPSSAIASGTFSNWCVKWVYGPPGSVCSTGCCCAWTVPTNVTRVTWEVWGAGGNGHGECNCNRCGNWHASGGGYYNTKTHSTSQGCVYTVCAGGTYRCCSRAVSYTHLTLPTKA